MNFNPNANPYAMQDRLHAEAEAEAERQSLAAEAWDAEYPDLDQHLDPERFVSEADMEAPSAQDMADLAWLDDMAQHSWTL